MVKSVHDARGWNILGIGDDITYTTGSFGKNCLMTWVKMEMMRTGCHDCCSRGHTTQEWPDTRLLSWLYCPLPCHRARILVSRRDLIPAPPLDWPSCSCSFTCSLYFFLLFPHQRTRVILCTCASRIHSFPDSNHQRGLLNFIHHFRKHFYIQIIISIIRFILLLQSSASTRWRLHKA